MSISGLLLSACTAPVPGPESESTLQASGPAGVYRGVVPCVDCEGIDTVVELRQDGTWQRTLTYLGSAAPTVTSSGPIVRGDGGGPPSGPDGAAVLLLFDDSMDQGEPTNSVAYLVEPDALLQLDRDRERITGDLADRYRLRLIGREFSDPRDLDGEWWVEELAGVRIEPDRTRRRRPHLRFDFVGSRLSFTGGCNQFAGVVEFDGPGRVSMGGPFAGTRMLCPGRADLDQELTDTLQTIRRWRIHGDSVETVRLELAIDQSDTASLRLMRPSAAAVPDGGEDDEP